jgi:hypothetical protein
MVERREDEPKGPGTQRGGQEPPPGTHDRPEQNRGYDEAAREGPPAGDARFVPGPGEARAPREDNELEQADRTSAVDEVRRER